MQKRKRPVMIGILSVFNMVIGALMMLGSFGMKSGAEGAILFALGLFAFVVGIGLFRLRSWARKAAIVGYILNVVGALAESNGIGLLVALAILAYLFSNGVKDAFSVDYQKEIVTEPIVKGSEVSEAPVP